MRSLATAAGATRRALAATPAASFHWQSAGTISVATCPGGASAASIAATVSPATSSALRTERTQPETGFASETMSLVSGASAARCQLAWSPITFTSGERARRALWRFAMPLAKPGPRWSSVIAGRSVRRA